MNEESLMLSHPVDYWQEIRQSYFRITATGELPVIQSRIDDLADDASNSASEKLLKIKKPFEKSIGQELGRHYIVGGEHGESIKDCAPEGSGNV